MKDGYIINFSLHHLCIYLLKDWENVLFYIRDVDFKRGPKVSAVSRHLDLGAGCIKAVRPTLQTSELGRPFILRQLPVVVEFLFSGISSMISIGRVTCLNPPCRTFFSIFLLNSVPKIGTKAPSKVKLVEVGGELRLKCRAQVRPAGQPNNATSHWLKDGKMLTLDPSRLRIKPNKWLKVKHVTQQDQGKYTCVFKNRCGEDTLTYDVKIRSGCHTKPWTEYSCSRSGAITVITPNTSTTIIIITTTITIITTTTILIITNTTTNTTLSHGLSTVVVAQGWCYHRHHYHHQHHNNHHYHCHHHQHHTKPWTKYSCSRSGAITVITTDTNTTTNTIIIITTTTNAIIAPTPSPPPPLPPPPLSPIPGRIYLSMFADHAGS